MSTITLAFSWLAENQEAERRLRRGSSRWKAVSGKERGQCQGGRAALASTACSWQQVPGRGSLECTSSLLLDVQLRERVFISDSQPHPPAGGVLIQDTPLLSSSAQHLFWKASSVPQASRSSRLQEEPFSGSQAAMCAQGTREAEDCPGTS